MFGSNILEVAIGLVFVYLFLSLICSAINEWIALMRNKRGTDLFEGVKNLLNDPKFTALAQQVFTHGLVDGISQEASNRDKPNRLPSYMASNTFALALLDILSSKGLEESWSTVIVRKKQDMENLQEDLGLTPTSAELRICKKAETAFATAEAALQSVKEIAQLHIDAAKAAGDVTGPEDHTRLQTASAILHKALATSRALVSEHPDPLDNIQRAVAKLPDGHTKESLFVLLDKTKREAMSYPNTVITPQYLIEKLQANIEQWFDETMDRVGGWYKRWTQKILLATAIILVAVGNVDTFMLAKRLMRDNILRASLVSAAENITQAGSAQVEQTLRSEVEKLSLPLGWLPAENDPYQADFIPDDSAGWVLKFLGLIISALAISMGAPFWFDTLSKFINIRGAGTPPGETKKSAPQPVKI